MSAMLPLGKFGVGIEYRSLVLAVGTLLLAIGATIFLFSQYRRPHARAHTHSPAHTSTDGTRVDAADGVPLKHDMATTLATRSAAAPEGSGGTVDRLLAEVGVAGDMNPITRVCAWVNEYKVLLAKAKEIQAASTAGTPTGRHGNPWVSNRDTILKVVADINGVFTDASVRRLVREVLSRTPWLTLALWFVLSTASSWAVLHMSVIEGRVFDAVTRVPGSSDEKREELAAGVWADLMFCLMLYILDDLLDIVVDFVTDNLRIAMEQRARTQFFRAVLRQDAAVLDALSPADAQTNLSDAPSAIFDAALSPARMIREGIKFVGATYAMCMLDWKLTLVSTALRLPMTLNVAAFASSLTSVHWHLANDLRSRSGAFITEILQNVRFVQMHAAEEVETEQYSAFLMEGVRQSRVLRVVERLVWRMSAFLQIASRAGTLMFAAQRVMDGVLTVGGFTVFQRYVITASDGLRSLIHEASRLRTAARKCEKFFQIVDNPTGIISSSASGIADVPSTTAGAAAGTAQAQASGEPCAVTAAPPAIRTSAHPPASPKKLQGRITFDNVTFQYNAAHGNTRATCPALDGLSFSVSPGGTVAFVGLSGAGKSTIFKLLMRFYDVQSGAIQIDGHDLRDYNVQFLRRQIGYVEQEPTMFNRSILENITYGFRRTDPDFPSLEQVHEAARRAHIHDVIMALPDGYDTKVGPRGSVLSGGQKQRLAIARAFVRNPAILLLDEVTAALDAESEEHVKAGIESLMQGRTVLIVAHRLKTVEAAHCIHVLQKGSIVESGPHAALVVKPDGVYRRLVERQAFHHDALLATQQLPAGAAAGEGSHAAHRDGGASASSGS